MPRLTQSVPRYRRHKASGQAVTDINGKRHYLGPHGTKASRLEYDRLITEWLASGRSPLFGVPEQQLSIAEMLVAYLSYARKYYGDSPKSEYVQMLRTVRPLRRLYGREPARTFDGLKLKAVRQHYIDAGNCRLYVNTSVKRLVRVFRWAASEGLIPPDVPAVLALVPGLRRGKCESPEGRKVFPIQEDKVAATLPFLPRVVQAMVELQQLTGMRPGELVIMRPCDVDRTGDVWEYTPDKHKTQNRDLDRTIYIGPRGQAVLRPFLLGLLRPFVFHRPNRCARYEKQELKHALHRLAAATP
jgi:integrase